MQTYFLEHVMNDPDFKVAVLRDCRTGVNYLEWYEVDGGGHTIEKAFCPMFGADGKPLVSDKDGNILPEQRFHEETFKAYLGL